jgi:uncharacterized membrane protein YdbT with pleckstrin-like domain
MAKPASKKPASRKNANETQRPRQRVAKGRRPLFMRDPDVDKLLAMIMAMTGEIALLRGRLDTHERLLAAGRLVTPETIESFLPDAAAEAAREAQRQAMLTRVFRILAVAETQAQQPDINKLVDDAIKK